MNSVLMAVAYICNIFPIAAMQYVSPFEELYQRPWDRGYGRLEPFGCLCFINVADAERISMG